MLLASEFIQHLLSPYVLGGVQDGRLNGLLNPGARRALFKPGRMVTAAVGAVHVHPRMIETRQRVGPSIAYAANGQLTARVKVPEALTSVALHSGYLVASFDGVE